MNFLSFIESSVFSNVREELLEDESFQEFQAHLLENPESGDTVSGTGGCKKIRWNRQGTGKSGGVRVIYFLRTQTGKIYLLVMYPKAAKDDLSASEKAALKAIVQKLK